MARRKRKRWESAELNNRTYQHYFNRLMELSISMFEWQNLPDTVDARFLEYTLFTDGMAVFFNDEVIGHLCLQTMIGGKLDVYRIPTIRTAYASNGYNRKLSEKDSVIIFNNMIHTNCINDVELYARRLYECDRTMDVNIKAQKTPVMIACDENQRLTMINLYQQYDGNEPFIFGNKDIDIKKIQSITTNAPFVSDKIMDIKNQIWNEALTYLGISNVSYQKKERLISDEVSRSMGGTVASRYTRLDMRQQACEKINKMFGLDIWVEYREDTKMVTDDTLVQEEGEGNE